MATKTPTRPRTRIVRPAEGLVLPPPASGVSPAIITPDTPFEYLALERVRPTFVPFEPSWRGLHVLDTLPEPLSASPTDPQGLWVQFLPDLPSLLDGDAGVAYFLKGVALYTSIVRREDHGAVERLVRLVDHRIMQGLGLPQLDVELAGDFQAYLDTLFKAREEIMYRWSIAFTTGIYWLLSYTDDREEKHGERSPREWCSELANRYAFLSYVPQG